MKGTVHAAVVAGAIVFLIILGAVPVLLSSG